MHKQCTSTKRLIPINATITRAYGLLALTALIWASNAVAGRIAAAHIAPESLTFFRWTLAAVIILPFAWRHLRKDWVVLRTRLPYVIFMGVTGFAGFNLCLYSALNHTTAIFATIAQAAIPAMVMVAAMVVLRERLSGLRCAGFALTICGVLLTVGQGSVLQVFSQVLGPGELWMLLAALLYAAYSFGLRYRPTEVHWLSLMSAMVVVAAFFALPFGLAEFSSHGLPTLSVEVVGLVFYTALMASLLSQSAYAAGVAIIGPSRASLFINAVPVFGAVLAVLLLGEVYRWYHAVGLLLVLGGIALAEHAARHQPPQKGG